MQSFRHELILHLLCFECMEYTLIDNAEEKQYEYKLEEGTARVEYIKTTDKIFLTHTEVPRAYEGKGVASALVADVLKEVEKSGLALIPLCPYVAGYIKRHPEWRALVMKNINIG